MDIAWLLGFAILFGLMLGMLVGCARLMKVDQGVTQGVTK